MSEHDKEEHVFLLEFILHEVFLAGTVDQITLPVISENEVESFTNVLLELQLNLLNNIRYLILLL